MSLNGIDISSNQPKDIIDKVPYDFCIVKAGGNPNSNGFAWNYVNPYFKAQMDSLIKKGKLVGAYWFLFGRSDATEEAKKFVELVKPYIGKCMLVADYEETALSKGTSWLKTFMDYVYKQTGVKPLVYCSKSVLRSQSFTAIKNAGYGLWYAQYANYNAVNGYQTSPWTDSQGLGAYSKANMFQYTSSLRLSGYNGNLDGNIFYGTKEEFKAFYKATGNSGSSSSTTNTSKPTGSTQKKSNETIATEVIAGKWGNGTDRKKKLEAAGYDYQAIQDIVNKKLGVSTSKTYKIQPGDTLSGIAEKYGTTVNTLLNLNPSITDKNVIYAGNTIKIS